MAVDTPATIAVIGAGPIGIEAALYARFLGYDVRVYERARIVEHLLSAADQSKTLLWNAQTSPLGIAALAAQCPGWQPPPADQVLSAAELTEWYYLPLAQSDLLVDCVLVGTEVVMIDRDTEPGGGPIADDEVPGFRLRVRDARGEQIEKADVVIDASGAVRGAGQSLHAGLRLGTEDQRPVWTPSASTTNPARLLTAEPDCYILGAKSAIDPEGFRVADGLAQIRDLFTMIADRVTLDLYATIGAPR